MAGRPGGVLFLRELGVRDMLFTAIETTATLCVDEQAARALAEELKDDVLKDQPARSDALAMPDGGWSFRMGDCRAGAIACVERSSADNGFIHQLDEYVVFKGFECVVVKPMSAAAAREKTHALPKPDDSAGINQKLRKRSLLSTLTSLRSPPARAPR